MIENKTQKSLIPLIIEEKIEEVIEIINNGNFDPYELSEGGRGLLYVCLLLDKYNIAEKLIQFSKKSGIIFDLYIKDNKELDYHFTIIDDNLLNKEKLEKNLFFIKNHKLPIPNFNFIMNCFFVAKNSSQVDLRCFEEICFLNKENIKKLDPILTIMQLGKIGDKNLIQLYYNVCDFNMLPLHNHPSFQLLKDVFLNAPNYIDQNIYTSPLIERDKSIDKTKLQYLENAFNNIKNDSYSFMKLFGKNGSALEYLSEVFCYKNYINYGVENFQPNKEYAVVSEMMSSFVKGLPIMQTHKKITEIYLQQWPLQYFDGKSYAEFNIKKKELDVEKEIEDKVNEIIKKYNLCGFSFSKNINIDKAISLFETFTTEVKKFIHVGSHQLQIQNICQENIKQYFL